MDFTLAIVTDLLPSVQQVAADAYTQAGWAFQRHGGADVRTDLSQMPGLPH